MGPGGRGGGPGGRGGGPHGGPPGWGGPGPGGPPGPGLPGFFGGFCDVIGSWYVNIYTTPCFLGFMNLFFILDGRFH